jgi:hypothetical protein
MKMSSEEVKQYWQDYCKRHKVAPELVARGNERIDQDPEQWADRTMGELLAEVSDGSGRLKPGNHERR